MSPANAWLSSAKTQSLQHCCLKLLVRLLQPTGGTILLDGIPLQEYDLEDLWKEIGVIFQDFVHYEMTAAENIAAGRIEDLDNLPNLIIAAKKSSAHGLIDSLPEGYTQILGRRSERLTSRAANGRKSRLPEHICVTLSS